MKVYVILYENEYDETYSVDCIFSSKKKAEEFLEYRKQNNEFSDFKIEEYILNEKKIPKLMKCWQALISLENRPCANKGQLYNCKEVFIYDNELIELEKSSLYIKVISTKSQEHANELAFNEYDRHTTYH